MQPIIVKAKRQAENSVHPDPAWVRLGPANQFWELLRYYLNLRGDALRQQWQTQRVLFKAAEDHPKISRADSARLNRYILYRSRMLHRARSLLRTQDAAVRFCESRSIEVGRYKTRVADHPRALRETVAWCHRRWSNDGCADRL